MATALIVLKWLAVILGGSFAIGTIAGHGMAFMGGSKRRWFANPLDHFDSIPASDGDA